MHTFRKLLSVRLNSCEKMSPLLYTTECHFWEHLWNRAGRERRSSAAKNTQHCLQNRKGWSCDSDLSSDFPLVMPNKCSGSLYLWTQVQRSLRSALTLWWHRDNPQLVPCSSKTHQAREHSQVWVWGLCFWGGQNQKSLFSKASKHLNLWTTWAQAGCYTPIHAVLGNKTVPKQDLQIHICWI